jgi:hypothetical protein
MLNQNQTFPGTVNKSNKASPADDLQRGAESKDAAAGATRTLNLLQDVEPRLLAAPIGAGFEHYEFELEVPKRRRLVVIEQESWSTEALKYTARYATRRILSALAKNRSDCTVLHQRGLSVPDGLRKTLGRALPEQCADLPALYQGYLELLQRDECTLQELIVALAIANLAALKDNVKYLSLPVEDYAARLAAYRLRDHGITTLSSEYAIFLVRTQLKEKDSVGGLINYANLLRKRAFDLACQVIRERIERELSAGCANIFLRIDALYSGVIKQACLDRAYKQLEIAPQAVTACLAAKQRVARSAA